MKRFLITKLESWKNSKYRKPLILQGVRQVGKTWLLNEFGRNFFENIAYFNFEEQENLKNVFETTKEINRIIETLTVINRTPIQPGKTLIIFDEIQECNNALNSLKYFCEKGAQYHVACAGSLLGITISKPASFPVGKVDFMQLYPMTFSEFLVANHDEYFVEYMNNLKKIEPIPELLFNQLKEKLKIYFITGGMPEVVRAWTEEKNTVLVQTILKNILNAYELDFSKHAEIKDIAKLGLIWHSIPSQLAKENKKFMFNAIKSGARAREYEDALTWLCNAGMAYKIYCVTKPGIPVSAYKDMGAFKLFSADIGLLRRLALLDPIAFSEGNRLFTEFKGALTENYVLQSLINMYEEKPCYWTSGGQAEVDFVLQHGNDIIPIEVKSDQNTNNRSLTLYGQKYEKETKIKLRFSLKNLKKDDNFINIPLFLIDYTENIISMR